MRLNTTSQTRRIIQLVLCCIGSLICLIGITKLGLSRQQIFQIAGFSLPKVSLQGLLSSITMFCCILMVFIHYSHGSKAATFIIFFSLISSTSAIFRSHSLSALPGVISPIVSLTSILIIYHFYKKSTINSYTDLITGLKNRRKFLEELQDRICSQKEFQIACLEIEDFKQLNDIYGIQVGDYILKECAKELKKSLGKKNSLFKITGAIFTIIFDGECDAEELLFEAIKPKNFPLPLENDKKTDNHRTTVISFAAGIARYPEHGTDDKQLFKKADIALAYAKKSSVSKLCTYTEELELAEIKQKEAEALIRESLENDYFYLVYQPQFTIADKKLRGFETLIRCKKPDGSIVSPALFIPAAEKSNLILKIDDYVLKRAMKEFKPVLEKKGENYIISINVSAKNIGMEDFSSRVKAIIAETNFPPKCLEIEITEYSLAESLATTIKNINDLRTIGVKIALDDFGTGYTSIAQLMNLPINLLKIDKSLIDNIESNSNIRDLVDSVIYMGHIMNCEVISEGVENEQQIGVLKAHKCDFVQGFVWGKPVSFNDAVNFIN